MRKETKEQLLSMGEAEYRDFSAALIPESKPLIGVRLPALRTFAKEIVKNGNWKEELDSKDEFFEEVMLRGMLIGYGTGKDKNLEEAFELLDEFIKVVDNWSVCDSCCASFDFFESHQDETWEHIQKFLYSDKEFQVRVGLIMLLDHFLKCDDSGKKMKRRRSVKMQDLETGILQKRDGVQDYAENPQQEGLDISESGLYIEKILETLNRPFTQGYYAQMAAAWLTAECFVTFSVKTWMFLQENKMDDFTYNKALQKICESRIPVDEVKRRIRDLKRK